MFSAVTPQRAIINIDSAGSVTNETQQGKKMHVHSFDDAGKICAAGLLTDQQSTCCLGCDATTCDHQHSQ
jgi:hypothetical protein